MTYAGCMASILGGGFAYAHRRQPNSCPLRQLDIIVLILLIGTHESALHAHRKKWN